MGAPGLLKKAINEISMTTPENRQNVDNGEHDKARSGYDCCQIFLPLIRQLIIFFFFKYYKQQGDCFMTLFV